MKIENVYINGKKNLQQPFELESVHYNQQAP